MTNLVLFPEEADNAYWTLTNTTISVNSSFAPNGTLTADKCMEDTAVAHHGCMYLAPGFSVVSGSDYTWSAYLRAAGRSQVECGFDDAGFAAGNKQIFDLNGGGSSVSNSSYGSGYVNVGASTVDAGDGWVRCIHTVNVGSTSATIYCDMATLGTNNYAGDGSSGMDIWGVMVNAGSVAEDYIVSASSPQRGLCLSNFGYSSRMVGY